MDKEKLSLNKQNIRYLIPGENDLATKHPELAAQWHPIKNGDITPAQITCGSEKKVWWLGFCGHEWEASIYNRVKGRGCPICIGKKILVGFNDLYTTHLEIAKEWHPFKNGVLTPDKVTAGSHKKVWWKCSKGHEWQAVVANRAKGIGCPYCSGRYAIKDETDLITINPQLVREWHPTKNSDLQPTDVTVGSGRKVWWLGECGHEWKAAVYSRNDNVGCPYCSGVKVLAGFNDLVTVNYKLAQEWHPTKNGNLQPTDVSAGSEKKAWWLGECGHEWKAQINSRSKGIGCPICANELKTSFPEQTIYYYLNQITQAENRFYIEPRVEIDVYLPEYKLGIEYDGEAWHQNVQKDLRKNQICEKNGVRLIRVRENNCPFITGECITLQRNTEEELKEAIQTICGILKKTVDVNIERDRNKIYDQYMINNKKNNVQACLPNIAKEWHALKNGVLTPDKVMAGSHKKVWWKCDKGHEWQAVVASRAKGIGCPYCSGKKVQTKINDLSTTHPELIKQWHPTKNEDLTPMQVTAGSQKKVWWKCSKGHEWQARISHRSNGIGCPYCSGRYAIEGETDLPTVNSALIKEWHPIKNEDLTPIQVSANSHKKVWWMCEKGHEWQASIADRTHNRGCPYCSGKRVLKGFNDLETVNFKLAQQWHPLKNENLKPTDITAGSGKKVWWMCERDHEWQALISNRSKGSGCPYCSNHKKMRYYGTAQKKENRIL